MFGSRRTTTKPGNGPGRGFVAASGFVGLVAVALVAVLIYAFFFRDTTTSAGPAVTPSAPASTGAGSVNPAPLSSRPAAPTPVEQQGRPAGCTTTGSDQKVPLNPITGTKWTLVDGFAVPATENDGPMIRAAAGIGYCYSHTPDGAVLAASNFGHGSGTAQAVINATLAHAVVPGPLTSQVAATPATPVGGGGGGIQLAGFRVISYSPTTASVALALSSTGAQGSYSTVTLVLEWSAGDWRVVTQPGPSFFLNPSTASSLAGFITWSGVS